ncbi:MAG: hypothetical protein ACOYB2_11095 [Limnohabitans sp.]
MKIGKTWQPAQRWEDDEFREARRLDELEARDQVARMVARVERGDELDFGFARRDDADMVVAS